MTVYCKLSSRGNPPENNVKSLKKAIEKVSRNGIKRHKSNFSNFFAKALRRYASRSSVPTSVTNSFYLDISGNKLSVKSSNLLLAEQYEYGWEDDAMDDEQYSDYTNITPRYFIRPALKELEEYMFKTIQDEVFKEYDKEADKNAFLVEWHADIPTKYEDTDYFQKYSGING